MDEEYKFDESEAAPASTPLDAGVSSVGEEDLGLATEAVPSGGGIGQILSKFKLDKAKLKRFAGPLIIIVSILAIYLIFTFYSARKDKAAEQERLMAQQSAAMIEIKQPEEYVAPIPAPEPVQYVSEEQETMKQNIESMSRYMEELKNYVSKLNAQVADTQQEISIINQNIEQITMALQHVFMDVEKLKNPPKKVVKKKVKAPVAYYVRAIVPGRVWLESADGKSVTLRVGDRLAGYGEVRMISPRQGMVVMSNGSIIQYGINDM